MGANSRARLFPGARKTVYRSLMHVLAEYACTRLRHVDCVCHRIHTKSANPGCDCSPSCAASATNSRKSVRKAHIFCREKHCKVFCNGGITSHSQHERCDLRSKKSYAATRDMQAGKTRIICLTANCARRNLRRCCSLVQIVSKRRQEGAAIRSLQPVTRTKPVSSTSLRGTSCAWLT